ncbi:hypothetical protein [Butyrivibrio sp. VCB2006]|uniref:hypothetical protein n=1 Tax=Butyrivibrio sp. VCB2006 TaxID=1280679 RepID=UPI0004189D05|nr:hypothetical protein [Butyrivibrio sp. VCB2006]
MGMFSSIKKNKEVVFVIMFIMGVCLFWGVKKADFFCDELYTFGLSNGYFTPFISDVTGGDMAWKEYSGGDFWDYLTVGKDDRFAYDSVIYNQSKDVHPPLHYMILHTLCSFFPGFFSKWLGLIPNMIFYIFTLVALYQLNLSIFGKKKYGIASVVLYGLGIGGITTVMMIRMYMLMTMLTVFLALIAVKLVNSTKGIILNYFCLAIILFLGVMTQYFFVFYAFFLCAFLVIDLFFEKRYLDVVRSILSAVCGALAFAAFYFTNLNNATNQGKGGESFGNLFRVSNLIKTAKITKEVVKYFPIATILLTLVIVLLVIGIPKIRKKFRFENEDKLAFLVIMPAVIAFMLITMAIEILDLRYVYSLIPVLLCLFTWLWAIYDRAIGEINLKMPMVILIMLASIVVMAWTNPKWVYAPNEGKYDVLRELDDSECIYLTDNNSTAPRATQDICQLAEFDNVFFVDNLEDERIEAFIDGKAGKEFVLYLKRGERAEDDIIAEKFENNYGFANCSLLYTTDWSRVYRLSY